MIDSTFRYIYDIYPYMDDILDVDDLASVWQPAWINANSPTLFINKDLDIPANFSLSQNYSNPFNLVTTIEYFLHKKLNLSIVINDFKNKDINQIININQSGGFQSLDWDTTDINGYSIPSGIYFYTIKSDGFRETKKIIFFE